MDLPRFCSGHLIASYAIKAWMGVTHFLMRTLRHVHAEMALNVLAYILRALRSALGGIVDM